MKKIESVTPKRVRSFPGSHAKIRGETVTMKSPASFACGSVLRQSIMAGSVVAEREGEGALSISTEARLTV